MAGGNGIVKVLMYVGIGLVVVVAEIGLSYFAVNQLMARRHAASATEGSEAGQGDSLVTSPPRVVAPVQQQVQPEETPAASSGEENMDDAAFSIEGAYTLSDFVINPAYSQGKHFFVSSMVFAFKDKSLVPRLQEREPVLQDRIINSLSKRTFAWFGEAENREALRVELARIACGVLNIENGVKVYFTKYVLQ